jgi:hypothetical protein
VVQSDNASAPQVTWTIEANHGGGYAYRLAPAGLDEGLLSLSLPILVHMENPYGTIGKSNGSE